MSKADQIFIENVKDILTNGVWDTDRAVRPKWADDGSPAHTIKKFGIVNRYRLDEEFPIQTLRYINFKAAVDEILWIWQKKSNRIDELGSKIWDAWADENGTIGKAYGYQLAKKSLYAEGEFDQVDMIRYQLKNNPGSRRIIANMFNHEELHEMALYPCAYSLTLNVSGDTLNAILNQRSNDFLVANNWNVAQYAILVHMFAIDAGLKVGELLHVVADAHIYDRHVPIIKDVIAREEHPAPKLIIDPSVKNFYDFTPDSFTLENYEHSGKVGKLPVAV